MVRPLHSQAGRRAHVCGWGHFNFCKLRQTLSVECLLSINEASQVTKVVDLWLCVVVNCVLQYYVCIMRTTETYLSQVATHIPTGASQSHQTHMSLYNALHVASGLLQLCIKLSLGLPQLIFSLQCKHTHTHKWLPILNPLSLLFHAHSLTQTQTQTHCWQFLCLSSACLCLCCIQVQPPHSSESPLTLSATTGTHCQSLPQCSYSAHQHTHKRTHKHTHQHTHSTFSR